MPQSSHPLINQSLHARHAAVIREQYLVAQVKSAYSVASASIAPHVNSLMSAYAGAFRQQQVDASDSGQKAKVPITWLTSATGGKVGALQKALTSHIGTFAATVAAHTTQAQQQAVQAATSEVRQALHTALSPAIQHGADPSQIVQTARQSAIQALVGRASNGTSLTRLFGRIGSAVATSVYQDLIMGLGQGWGPQQVASQLWQDIGGARSQALTIARTELLGAWRQATSINYQANSDTVDGWYWMAALDGRCCGMCAAMNGTFHSLSETLDSHVQCRCAMTPKTKSWADILGPLGIDSSDIPETSLSDSDFQSGADWLSQQDAATQQDVLGGKAAYAAYQQGAFTLNDLIGTAYNADWGDSRYQKSLKQLGIDASDYLD